MEESTRYVNGWLLPAGINVKPEPVLVACDDYMDIVNMIGGNCRAIDAVRGELGDEDGNRTIIVGYVDDEGLYDEAAEVNFLASTAFNRSEPLVGNVVVVGGINPTTGEYDGDNHDLPQWLCDSADGLVAICADTYNKSCVASAAIMYALDEGIIDQVELDRLLNAPTNEQNLQDVAELAVTALRYVEMQADAEDDSESIADAVERLTSFDWDEE